MDTTNVSLHTQTEDTVPLVSETCAPSPQDSARNSVDFIDGFHKLINDINDILGPSNGIDSDDVDVEELKAVMRVYNGEDTEWQKYAFADLSRPYTRNLVDRGNGKSNLLILVWTPGKSSPIHDHANAHCVMRILKGSLTETIYNWPCQHSSNPVLCATSPSSLYPSPVHTCSSITNPEPGHGLTVKQTTMYGEGEVTYMSDRLGLHRVGNAAEGEVAVSLHLYTPPNAANHGCHVFNEQTGLKSKVQQCHFYSELGVRTT
ncbi:hypothetical protein LTR62_002138 [Meristemomyces frigidus]|uniref:Cysteine dioxygenase n=1 Tax=Meristemomyces frigidus TaxID=1508187 RepID=A0AAN7YAX5_9PEZI|nr:hypothetical protein LTR62_002138 [Meristemomyces frigidus]